MTRKQIDTMREVRLWIGQIAVPAFLLVGAMSPESRENLRRTVRSSVDKIQNKFRKKEP